MIPKSYIAPAACQSSPLRYILFSLLLPLLACSLFFFRPTAAQAVVNGCCEFRLDPNEPPVFSNMTDTDCEKTFKIKFTVDYETIGDPPTGCVPKGKPVEKKEPSIFSPPDISVYLPGMKPLEKVTCPLNGPCSIPWIGRYISALLRYGIGAISLIAAIVLMSGGLLWITSAGNDETVGKAKKLIIGSISGLILAFSSYLILYIINPDLVRLKSLQIQQVDTFLLKTRECVNGDCTAADEGIAALTLPVPKDFVKALVAGGELCDQKDPKDGTGSCGFGQVTADNRRKTCKMSGTNQDCVEFKKNPALDIKCVALVMLEQSPRAGNFSDIRKTAAMYNSGGLDCSKTTKDYCGRVERYLKEKCF